MEGDVAAYTDLLLHEILPDDRFAVPDGEGAHANIVRHPYGACHQPLHTCMTAQLQLFMQRLLRMAEKHKIPLTAMRRSRKPSGRRY